MTLIRRISSDQPLIRRIRFIRVPLFFREWDTDETDVADESGSESVSIRFIRFIRIPFSLAQESRYET
jgi:hypothetical protein